MKFVKPIVFPIAETRLIQEGAQDFLDFLGVPDWETDAASQGEELIEIAGKTCYMSFSTDLNSNLTRVIGRNNHDYIQEGLVKTKHGSCLEHATVTFAMMNVSRIVTHELVRHRQGAAYSQLSGRYVRLDEVVMADLPDCLENDPYAKEVVKSAVESVENFMQTLARHFDLANSKDFAFKKEVTSAIRRIIGNGQANHIIATFNHRAIRHIISMRSSVHAEEEIRRVAEQMWDIVSVRYPAIYADGKVEVVKGIKQITFDHDKV
jgi:thymidylate synthase (FAD)